MKAEKYTTIGFQEETLGNTNFEAKFCSIVSHACYHYKINYIHNLLQSQVKSWLHYGSVH